MFFLYKIYTLAYKQNKLPRLVCVCVCVFFCCCLVYAFRWHSSRLGTMYYLD